MNNRKDIKLGFTLAEVLITLVIIGVIAAMTVPTLMKNTQKQEFVSGLKKTNATLQQAVINISRNNDAAVGDYSFLKETDFVDEFAKVANVIKKCNSTTECFSSSIASKYKFLNNGTLNSIADGKSLILADGQIFTYTRTFGSPYGLTQEDTSNVIGRIAIDINGLKPPNVCGRDFFLFYIVDGKGIVPAGADSVTDCSTSGRGYTCSGRVLKENAMNY